jgi:hypothetical protein
MRFLPRGNQQRKSKAEQTALGLGLALIRHPTDISDGSQTTILHDEVKDPDASHPGAGPTD